MKNRTSDKLTALSLAVVLVIVCFFAACQPTPEKPVVVGKGDGLSDLIEATPSPSSDVSPSGKPAPNNDALYEKLGAPKHWRFEESALDGKLNLTADVDITLPNVTQLPAATARLSAFTQEDLKKVAALFGAGDATWTQINHTMTKEQVEQEILDYKARRAAYKAEGNDEMVEKMDEDLEGYAIMYQDAPSEIELKNTKLKIDNLYEGEELNGETLTLIGFEGTTDVNGQSVYFMANNSYAGDAVNRICVNYGSTPVGYEGSRLSKPNNVSLTKEQAAAQASEIAKRLTDELALCYVMPAETMQQDASRKEGWACVFMREINGCPTSYESTEIGSDIDTTVDAPVAYEEMVIVMDDAGMISLKWISPMTLVSVDNPDVALLPFDEIYDRAKEHVVQRWAYEAVGKKDNEGKDVSDPGCTVKIYNVELGLMRIAKANSDDYYYIPVWNFFSDLEHTEDYYERTGIKQFADENSDSENYYDRYQYRWGAITVNALDGSIIDRNLGY